MNPSYQNNILQAHYESSPIRLVVTLLIVFVSLVFVGVVSSRRRNRPLPRELHTSTRRTAPVGVPQEVSNNDDENKNIYLTIQILYSPTGNGHASAALALRDALEYVVAKNQQHLPAGRDPRHASNGDDNHRNHCPNNNNNAPQPVVIAAGVQVSIVNLFGAAHRQEELNRLFAQSRLLWYLGYLIYNSKLGSWLLHQLWEWFCYDSFQTVLAQPFTSTGRRADVVVAVHAWCQRIPLKILRQLDALDCDSSAAVPPAKTPFCTVVTDIGDGLDAWFQPDVDRCFVADPVLYQKAQRHGLANEKIAQYGLPVRKEFWKLKDNDHENNNNNNNDFITVEDRRTALGLEHHRRTILVVGGGGGMGGIVSVSRAIAQQLECHNSNNNNSNVTAQLVVICGRNQAAQQALLQEFGPCRSDNTDAAGTAGSVPVHVLGFVDNMHAWMMAADVLVTKAGAMSVAEAALCSLPCLFYSYLPVSEAGNVRFAQESGFGTYRSTPRAVAETIVDWLSHPDQLIRMRRAADQAAWPRATVDIAQDIIAMALACKLKRNSRRTTTTSHSGR